MEDHKTNIDETLAIILSDLKKLISHFKLDRRKSGSEEIIEQQIVSQEDNELLRKIANDIQSLTECQTFSDEQRNDMAKLAQVAMTFINDF